MKTNLPRNPVSLSAREIEIIELVCTGLSNQNIAEKLEISKRTVDNHLSNILKKTNAGNRVGLMNWALHWGKVCIEDVNCCPIYFPNEHGTDNQALT